MPHQIGLDIADPVYDGLEQFAKDRGLDVLEAVKWLLGDFVHHNVPTTRVTSGGASSSAYIPSLPSPLGSLDKMWGIAKIFLAMQITKNDMRCPHCDDPLTVDGVEKNECIKCHKKLV